MIQKLLFLGVLLFCGVVFAEEKVEAPKCLAAGETGSVGGVPGKNGWKFERPCCKGLVDRTNPKFCEEPLGGSYQYICTTCGDKHCDAPSETKCNCPEDCGGPTGVKMKTGKSDRIYVQLLKLGKRLVIKTENGVCTNSGPRAYKVEGEVSRENKHFDLVCKVDEPKLKYDDKTPVDLIENFDYPKMIFADMNEWDKGYGQTEQFIKKQKHSWGKEYYWETPSSGSTRFIYLCPKYSKHCVRVKVGGLERLTFNFENMKK